MPQVVELGAVGLRKRRIDAPLGLWRRLCNDVPEGKALEITDLKPDDMTLAEFHRAYASAPRRYGCSFRTNDGRAFLVRSRRITPLAFIQAQGPVSERDVYRKFNRSRAEMKELLSGPIEEGIITLEDGFYELS